MRNNENPHSADFWTSDDDEYTASINATLESSQATTKKTIGILQETLTIGEESCVELHKQGDQLERCIKQVDEINGHMAVSKRLLRGISSIFGAAVNSVTKPSVAKPTEILHVAPTIKDVPPSSRTQPPAARTLTEDKLTVLTPQQRQRYAETDRDLDQISEMLSSLKDMALEMNRELDVQNENITILDKNVDKANNSLRSNIVKVRKQL